jgi:hypothetical protein
MENTSTLLTDELRKFGIMNQQDHFSEKLSKKKLMIFLKEEFSLPKMIKTGSLLK